MIVAITTSDRSGHTRAAITATVWVTPRGGGTIDISVAALRCSAAGLTIVICRTKDLWVRKVRKPFVPYKTGELYDDKTTTALRTGRRVAAAVLLLLYILDTPRRLGVVAAAACCGGVTSRWRI